jgi:hypothetical protein
MSFLSEAALEQALLTSLDVFLGAGHYQWQHHF